MKWKILPSTLALTLVFMLISLHSIGQFAASTNKSPNYNEPDSGVKLESFEVNFSVIGENGWLDAYTNEHGQFGSGTSIEQGTDVHFATFPNWGYIVKEWRVNNEVVEGNTSNVFTYSNIQAPIDVSVEFKDYIQPEITPDKQYFGLDEAEDVNFTLSWGSETEVAKITLYYEDEFNNYYETILTQGADYDITGDVLTIYASFIVSLSPEVDSDLLFAIEFGTGETLWFRVKVIQATSARISPTELTYDLTNPDDVMTTILWGTTAQAVGLISTITKYDLVEGTDYRIEGAWLYLHNTYLSQSLTASGNELSLNVLFDNGDEVLLNVTASQSGVTNATINPTSISFYLHEFPEYADITIIWNDATDVTNIHVLVSHEQGTEEKDWPFYEVTSNDGVTANLHINFDEERNSKSSNTKQEELSYITITIGFDIGAPALFLMTGIYVNYEVMVTINPVNAGWVSGIWDYSPGETVELSADPNIGYAFESWNDAITGDAVSFENPYIFSMPSHNVELVAHFVPAQNFTVNFSVIGENGWLDAYTNEHGQFGSGSSIEQGTDVNFAAYPNWGYKVKEWRVNNEVVEGNTSNVFTYSNIQAPIDVSVEFKDYIQPEITPYWQYFGLDEAEDVNFTLSWGSETEVAKITLYYEGEFNYYYEIILTQGADYDITGDVLTIYASSIVSLSPKVNSSIQLSIEFGTSETLWVWIEILQATSARISPAELTYDLTNPDDVMTTILWGTTAQAVELISTITKYDLVEGTDYRIEGAWLYLHNTYLSQNLTASGNELSLNVLFDNGDEVLLNVTASQSGVTNATINPTSISFYQHEFPEYADITITWNDATDVTNIHVLVSNENGSEEMDWPIYEITSNDGVTANLRLNFDEVRQNKSSNTKQEELTYITVTIGFDIGAPALFLMTETSVNYEVTATIDPLNAGWVSGIWNYTPGETVELEASPNMNYTFWSWNDAITGDAVSFENPYIFSMPSHDVELVAHFVPAQNFFTVNFSIIGENGWLNAYINDYNYIGSGTPIERGTDVHFAAYPNWGYLVKEWRVNNEVVEGNTSNVFTYSNIQAPIDVSVEFKDYIQPEITPDKQYFGLDEAEDVNFTLSWGSETEVAKITHHYEDEFNNYYETILTQGADYDITSDVLTIYASFIVSLSPEVDSSIQLSIEFGTGETLWFRIKVLQATSARISPAELTYDLTNPNDVMTTILWGTTAQAVELISTITKYDLVEGTDYRIEGAWLYLHNTYLSQSLTASGNELSLNVLFDNGDEVLLNVTASQSGVTNATINPTSISFYQHEFPEYADITITWNDATDVTNIHVLVSNENGSEEMDWPFYEVTSNDGVTANLRLNFDEVRQNKSSNTKQEELTYITITIGFDIGAPALFLITETYEYYEVTATIDPLNAGWVNGDWEYSPSETVELNADPNTGYAFWSWNDAITGDAVSFENPYIFSMPSHNVELVAHFVPAQNFTVNFSVIGTNGTLACEADGTPIASGDDVIIASKLVFTATPDAGYRVKEWVLNNNVVEAATSASLTIEMLDAPIELTVEFEPLMYTVTFAITEGTNPIEGATVNFDGTDYATNAAGNAEIVDVETGSYSYTVNKSGYTQVTGNITVTDADVNEAVSLTPLMYTVTFAITEGTNPIEGATVNFDGTDYATNAAGNAEIVDVETGSYNYTVNKSGYTQVTGNITVTDADVNEAVSLTPLMYTVTFAITEGVNPIQGATVNFDGTDYTTNATGIATITDVETGTYSYTVSMTDYTDATGSVTVTDTDVYEPVLLTPSSAEQNSISSIRAYPNPFGNHITITNAEMVKRVVITNLIGQQVMSINLNGEATINTDNLISGIYLITFEGHNGQRNSHKMVKH